MARRAKVTTRTGDTGYTGLIGKERVPKWDPRPDTFGTLDEATSALGIARAVSGDDRVKAMILSLQREIYQVMAELALSPEAYADSQFKITEQHVVDLETRTEELKLDTEIGNVFIIPGETLPGAALDLARTVVRRGERLAARLFHDGVITNAEILLYLNRLSDLLFVLARYEEQHAGARAQEARTDRTRRRQQKDGDAPQG
ncbi:MAG: cob(I)yrinic acid a,c-diamide adenosyltransferase [Dehalococcoidia bacterium]